MAEQQEIPMPEHTPLPSISLQDYMQRQRATLISIHDFMKNEVMAKISSIEDWLAKIEAIQKDDVEHIHDGQRSLEARLDDYETRLSSFKNVVTTLPGKQVRETIEDILGRLNTLEASDNSFKATIANVIVNYDKIAAQVKSLNEVATINAKHLDRTIMKVDALEDRLETIEEELDDEVFEPTEEEAAAAQQTHADFLDTLEKSLSTVYRPLSEDEVSIRDKLAEAAKDA